MADIEIRTVQTAVEYDQVQGPLGFLEATSNDLTVVKYPSDLANPLKGTNIRNHWVTFKIYDIQPASIEGATEGLTNNKTVVGINGKTAAAVAALGTATAALGVYTAVETEGAAGGGLVSAGAFAILGAIGLGVGFSVSPQISELKSCINLYMPDTLTASYDANYEEMSLTQDLGPAITTLRAISSAADGVIDAIVGKGNNLGSDPNITQALTAAAGAVGIPGVNVENLGKLLQRAQGFALNPQLQMVYRGTGLRHFQLTFTFTPKSKEEGLQVNNIINQFKFYSSPSLGQMIKVGGKSATVTQSTTNSMFLVPPSVFEIEFYVNGQKSENLPRYGRCVLTALDVNHAPNGFSTYVDSTMVQTTVQMSFKEMDILTRNNFNDGTNSRR
jgi:hypothetical protein